MKSVDTVATDGLGPVPARLAIVGTFERNGSLRRQANRERVAPSMRLSPERFCDDR
jgi:hypothetical protein